MLKRLNTAYEYVREKNNQLNITNNIQFNADQNIIRCPMAWDDAFLELLKLDLPIKIIRSLIGNNIQLIMQNIITNAPGHLNDQHKWHRDLNYQHFVSSRPIALNFLVALDDFTIENGATIVLPGSHRNESFPSDQFIDKHKVHLSAPKGSVILMDAMLYHRSGGYNSTSQSRRDLVPLFGTLTDIEKEVFHESEKSLYAGVQI